MPKSHFELLKFYNIFSYLIGLTPPPPIRFLFQNFVGHYCLFNYSYTNFKQLVVGLGKNPVDIFIQISFNLPINLRRINIFRIFLFSPRKFICSDCYCKWGLLFHRMSNWLLIFVCEVHWLLNVNFVLPYTFWILIVCSSFQLIFFQVYNHIYKLR